MPDPYIHVSRSAFDRLASGATTSLGADEDHYVRRVLRLGPGAGLVVSDGAGGQAPARLTRDGVALVGQPERIPAPSPRLYLVQSLAKARKVDDVVRAVTELGVSAVTVVAADRGVVKLGPEKARKARDRWNNVARSAAGQARRAHLPVVSGPRVVADIAAEVGDGVVGLVPHVGARSGLRPAASRFAQDVQEVRIAIGPEGGWTAGEVDVFARAGWVPVTMGRAVLRTEHAGLVAVAGVAAIMGWMDDEAVP